MAARCSNLPRVELSYSNLWHVDLSNGNRCDSALSFNPVGPVPGSIRLIILIGASSLAFFILSFPVVARCRIVKVVATDTSIKFSENWTGPTIFGFSASDPPNVGGPNSSVCAMGDISRYTTGTGEGFQFSFRGIGAQLVLTSRPDHSRFTVTYDSHTYAGDSYSQVVGCGAAWSSPVGSVVRDHVVTCTNDPVDSFTYLELLSILYDDGSDLPPPAPPTSTSTSSSTSSESTSTRNTSTAALPPNSPTVGSASDTGSPSGSVTSGGTDSSPSTSNPTDTNTVIQPTNKNPISSDGRPRRISVAAIACVAVSAAMAVLLVLFLLRRWRRRLLTRRSLRAVRPLSLTAPVVSDSTAVLMPPTVSPGEKAMREARPSMRLADEDIDRIAARMHDMIHSSVRHRRADSTGTVGSEARDTSLPSYFTSSAR